MAIAKAQFNPSTLKGIYNSVTGKLQMSYFSESDCAWCVPGQTPLEVEIKFRDIILCEDICMKAGSLDYKATFSEVFKSELNTVTHVLSQVGNYGSDACTWEKIYPNAITWRKWYEEDGTCTGEFYEEETMGIIIRCHKSSSDSMVITIGMDEPSLWEIFRTNPIDPVTGCTGGWGWNAYYSCGPHHDFTFDPVGYYGSCFVSGFADMCEHCSPNSTPYNLNVSFVNVVQCCTDCFIVGPGPPFQWSQQVIFDVDLNSETFTLFPTAQFCTWELLIPDCVHHWVSVLNNLDCTEEDYTTDYSLLIKATKLEGGACKLEAYIYLLAGNIKCFEKTYSPVAGFCMEGVGINNDIADCECETPPLIFMKNGTAVVEEVSL